MLDELVDYYAALEVSRNATPDEIRISWRRLARIWHPDRNRGSADAEAKFKELSAAWHVLSDPERRRTYDEEFDEASFEADARRKRPPCQKCGEPAILGLTLCVRCALVDRVDAAGQKRAKKARAEADEKRSRKERKRPPKTSPEQQRYEKEVEHLGDPDFYDDLIGARSARDYAFGTGSLDGDSLLEVLLSEASIRSAFEGRPNPKKKGSKVSRKDDTIIFHDGEGSEIRVHVDVDALRDVGRNLKTAERILRQIRRLFGGQS